ncbi:hypothetical protein ACFROC_35535 [Nocardia tengchongensis]|uniref:hypothetical protein n=1 Tax=Nocardia tengchongensis TaxID=2055889 RepID=UPI0036966250
MIVGAGMVLRNGFGWVVHLAATYPYRAGLITVSIAACGAAPTALKKFQGWRAAQAVKWTAKAARRRAQARGSGSNRAENNTYGWTCGDDVVIGSGCVEVGIRSGVG